MTPKLYNNSLELIGFLKDIISCTVTEKRNGMYECEFIYPLAGELYDELKEDCYILTKSNDNDPLQFFRIYSKSPEIRGKTTYKAEHISYLLNSNPIEAVKVENSSASTAINAIKDAAKISQGFTFTSDVNGLGSIDLQALSVKQALGGIEGSLLDVFGGEYYYNNKSVKLCAARGNDNGVRISYGKNMADFTQDLSIESTYTHVFPYFKTETGIVTLVSSDNPSGLISLSNPNNYTERALILELNVEGEEQPTKSTLQTKANAYIAQNSLNTPSISIKVSMVNLSDSPEFREYAELERCSLCDTVTVIHQPLKIKTKAKIIETVYDSIAERYISMTIGESTSTLSDSFQKTNNEIKKIANLYQKNTNTIQTMINNAVDASTKAITGNSGGHIRTYPEINPQELCVMDTDSIATARKIWRFNLSGFGYSSTGYNGTYRTAITMDGAINADFITTGTLTANIIRAGILSSATGNTYFNLDNGLLHTNNAEIEGGKISLGGYYGSDAIKTVIEQGHIDLYYNNSFSARLGQSETKGFTIEHTVGYPTFSFEWQNWGISGQFTEALRAVIHTRGGAVIDVGNGQNGLIINSSNTLINSPITAYGKITASGDMESGGLIKCHEFLTNNGAYSYIGTGGSYKLYYNSDWHIFSQIYSSRLALGIDAIPMDLYATSQIKCHATLVNSNGTAFKTNAAVHETITDANELVIPPDFMTYFENSDITISPPQIIATEAYQETQVIENPDGTISEEIIEHPATERREEKKVSFTDAEDAPDIIKLDDGIDIFSMAALMWKGIQNLNERLKALENQ